MRIEYYKKETGEAVPTGDYFVLNGDEVWCNNYQYYESQEPSISFDDCVVKCEEISWRLADT
jgi:hypothetical protein